MKKKKSAGKRTSKRTKRKAKTEHFSIGSRLLIIVYALAVDYCRQLFYKTGVW